MAKKFQSPKGTRDFYPEEMLRRRYITEAWRAVSLRHGFEEIDGPTFEHLDLYTVKSGEEIISQLFSFKREGGDDTYALRPEFTPTLARMYAAKAAQLPKPVRWFCVPSFFRAEKPQRGRLREFLQWNCDVIGKDSADADADTIAVCAASLDLFGLSPELLAIAIGDRRIGAAMGIQFGVPEDQLDAWYAFLDGEPKRTPEQNRAVLVEKGLDPDIHEKLRKTIEGSKNDAQGTLRSIGVTGDSVAPHARLVEILATSESAQWCEPFAAYVIRGLAYYTGTVFEVIAEGERAVAGGGRYDKLIELCGGPDTPAVGFAMGDVVLGNLLEGKGLMPQGAELMEAVEAMVRGQSVRPELFVVSGAEEDDKHVVPLAARLRRGIEREGSDAKPWQTAARYDVRPLHARTTDKSTRNPKKLLQDANRQFARLYCEIHGEDKVELKDLDRGEPVTPPDGCASFSVDPGARNYVGRCAVEHLERASRSVV